MALQDIAVFAVFAVFATHIALLRNWKVGQVIVIFLVGICKQIDRLLRPTVSKACSVYRPAQSR